MSMTRPSFPGRRSTCWPRAAAKGLGAATLLFLAVNVAGCSPDRLFGTSLPPNIPDPGLTHTAAGAVAAYYGALVLFRGAVGGNQNSYIPVSGLFADELGAPPQFVGAFSEKLLVDSRDLPDGYLGTINSDAYSGLQTARGQAQEAIGLLRAYDPDSLALIGHLDVLRGYTEVYLADLYCSGVPLSTLDYNGDYTAKPGSTTEQVYTAAAALFDSAAALAADSTRILNAARVGEGRVQLALGNYAAAAQAVAAVPDRFQYALHFSDVIGTSQAPGGSLPNVNFTWFDFESGRGDLLVTMVNSEGGNGLPFLSSGDPRTPWVANGGISDNGAPLLRPANLDSVSSIVLASGVEARLIQAEGALHSGDPSWLTILNTLRTDGTYDTVGTDTLWHAGTGGVAGLAPLADPGMESPRVDLLFHERGFWLFLGGQRQGDLRRLVRQYGRQSTSAYPSGFYPGAKGSYGTEVSLPIPPAEQSSNPLFTGCLSHGA